MQNTNFGIVKTFDENDFINEFKLYNRLNNFSIKGLHILFELLEQTAVDCKMNIEMDVIALCCEYNEASITDIIENYDIDLSDESYNSKEELVTEYLQDNTSICRQYEDDYGVTYFVYQVF